MSGLTLEDIARQAGVSRSTASRVVNAHPSVRSDVRERVNRVILETGYHPNAAARTLASQRSAMIGLVIPRSVNSFFTDPFFPYLIQGITQACNLYDYTLGLFVVGSKEDEEQVFPRVSRKGLLDGIIMQSGVAGDPLFNRLADVGIPLVVVGRPHTTKNVNYVDVDNVRASFTAVEHLIQLGRQRIATITGPLDHCESMDRRAGYIQALEHYRMPVEDALIAEADFTGSGAYKAMKALLAVSPDAVFAASDDMAFGAIQAIQEAGLRVPEDIAIVGFDDLPSNTIHSGIKLTTIHQPVIQFGAKTVELLIDIIEKGVMPARRVIMDTELIIRDTSGASRRQ